MRLFAGWSKCAHHEREFVLGVFWSTPPQIRHPACPGEPWERSASQICRITKGLQREVEGKPKEPRRCLIVRCFRELSGRKLHRDEAEWRDLLFFPQLRFICQ